MCQCGLADVRVSMLGVCLSISVFEQRLSMDPRMRPEASLYPGRGEGENDITTVCASW